MNSDDLSPLWARARAMFRRALAAIGDPAAIAALGALDRALRRRIVCWTALLECIVRKLLMAEAGRLEHKPPRPPRHDTRKSWAAPALRALRSVDPNEPRTWPVSFWLAIPRDPRRLPDARAPRIRALYDAPRVIVFSTAPQPRQALPPRPGAPLLAPAQRLARRLEALRRVLDNPLPHARRLARVLARARRRFPEVVHRYLWAAPRVEWRDPDDPRLIIDAAGPACAVKRALEDTS